MIFCTLFDSNYLDKGIVMYQSLNRVTNDFKIYILAMDEKCEKILRDLKYEKIEVINLESFCSIMQLSEARGNRSKGEFCWTCSSFLIDYVLSVCKEEICTYIDADLYFFDNPKVLIDEMKDETVQIVEHGFSNLWTEQRKRRESGKYCVEFNTFLNEKRSLDLLHWWENKCLESCSSNIANGGVLGDQGYLDGWEKYDFVSVVKNIGAGVAPWNIHHYKLLSKQNDYFHIKRGSATGKLIFYHFHQLLDINEKEMDICVFERAWFYDKKLVFNIYHEYIRRIKDIRSMLDERYGLKILIKHHPAYEPMQTSYMPFFKKVLYKLKNQGLKKVITDKVYFTYEDLKYKLHHKYDIIQIDNL